MSGDPGNLVPYRAGVRLENDHVIGPSHQETLDVVSMAARTQRPLLVTGESGTGKEQCARLYHALGPKPRGPFVAKNCADFTRELAAAELFGARKGSHSAATSDQPGLMTHAEGGTCSWTRSAR